MILAAHDVELPDLAHGGVTSCARSGHRALEVSALTEEL